MPEPQRRATERQGTLDMTDVHSSANGKSAIAPALAIIVPLYNRADLVGRTLESLAAQTSADFEIIVVDDGSSDSSCAIVEAFHDPRIRLIRHDRNRGVCPARNTGADHATAPWLVMLDSDDELLPNAVERILDAASTCDNDIKCIYFRCMMDNGEVSPGARPSSTRLTYTGYLQLLNACAGSSRDMLHCVRREVFTRIRFPDSFGLEDEFHLDFHRAHAALFCDDIIRLYHQDAANSLVKRTARFDRERDARFALDRAITLSRAVAKHGDAIRVHAPKLFLEFQSNLLTLWLLCGHRRAAIRAFLACLSTRSKWPRQILIFMVGFAHPRLLARLRAAMQARSRTLVASSSG